MEQEKQEQLEEIAKRIAVLQDEIAVRSEEVADLKARLLAGYDIGQYQAGDLKVSIQRGKRQLDTKRFQERFPIASNPKCYEIKPLSLSRLEKLVGSETLGDLIVRGKESVKVE